MKLGNKIQFGIASVQSGQKVASVAAEPQLIANSTVGKFTITPAVSKALGIAVGENVMFFNNIQPLEQAIVNKADSIVEYAKENGIDINTRDGQQAILKEFTVWFIAKGELKYKRNGEPIMAAVRMTKDDKAAYLKAHGMELVEANRDALKTRLGNPDATDEELLASITPDEVENPKYHLAEGSKTATTSNATGVGLQLNFTDTAIWNLIKEDLGEEKAKKNRIFNVLLDEGTVVPFDNGYKVVDVKAYPIEFASDENPIVRANNLKDAETPTV